MRLTNKCKFLITIAVLTAPLSLNSYIQNATLVDLESYISTISCLPKYFQCKHTLLIGNPDLDCLAWAGCSHLRTFEHLLQTKSIQTILSQNSSVQNTVDLLQKKYGLHTLQHQVQKYAQTDLQNLLEDLTVALVQDLSVLSNAGVQVPNSDN